MTPFAIAGVQMPVSAIASNVDAMILETDLLMARFPWVQMVVFSELAPFGPSPQNAPSEHEQKFQDLAHRHGIWLIPGSMFEREGEHIYNTSSVISPDGSVVARSLTALGAEVILHPVLTGTTDRDVVIAVARAAGAQAWGYENRTTAIRIPGGSPEARIIEHRVAAADANPYLVLAAILGSTLSGLKHQILPPPEILGDAHSQALLPLPYDWGSALTEFENGSMVESFI